MSVVETVLRARHEGGGTPVLEEWGVDSEYGRLLDVSTADHRQLGIVIGVQEEGPAGEPRCEKRRKAEGGSQAKERAARGSRGQCHWPSLTDVGGRRSFLCRDVVLARAALPVTAALSEHLLQEGGAVALAPELVIR